MKINFKERLHQLEDAYKKLITLPNSPVEENNGIYVRYKNPALTAAHIPPFWKYDLNEERNPFLMERFGINSVLNAGAIKWNDKYLLMARVEGNDRKSFFAIAESSNGVDNFKFRDCPVVIPETNIPDVNVYDIRLVRHEDGYIYGIFCTERKDTSVINKDQSAAVAQCGIVRTKDLKSWERLPDLKTKSPQQRNVVLHPKLVDGKYAFYTRSQNGFLATGESSGIGFGLSDSIENAEISNEVVVDANVYHTINELKNGWGPAPLQTKYGWLHLAHGVRNTAAGMRYTLYMFMTELNNPAKIIYKPAGYFLAPEGDERIGDVSNVVFSNGWIADEDGTVYIYYASSDTRIHVAVSSINRLLDYVMNTPADKLRSAASVQRLLQIIDNNKAYLQA